MIRIRSDALKADHPLGIKFGCDPITEAPKLLEIAAQMDLKVGTYIFAFSVVILNHQQSTDLHMIYFPSV